MDDAQLGRAVRALRHRRGWRQADLAARAGLSSSTVSLVERGHARDLSTQTVQAVASALGARLAWRLDWPCGELDSTLDADHAALQEIVAGMLQQQGWHTIAEASFNRFGDRGRIDLLGFHAASRTLLVIEVKTMIADIQVLLGRLDVKVRVAPALAATRGWRPAETRAALIVLDGSTPRRRVAQHAALFARFSLRGANATRWLRGPRQDAPAQGVGPPGLLVFSYRCHLPNGLALGRPAANEYGRIVRGVTPAQLSDAVMLWLTPTSLAADGHLARFRR